MLRLRIRKRQLKFLAHITAWKNTQGISEDKKEKGSSECPTRRAFANGLRNRGWVIN